MIFSTFCSCLHQGMFYTALKLFISLLLFIIAFKLFVCFFVCSYVFLHLPLASFTTVNILTACEVKLLWIFIYSYHQNIFNCHGNDDICGGINFLLTTIPAPTATYLNLTESKRINPHHLQSCLIRILICYSDMTGLKYAN